MSVHGDTLYEEATINLKEKITHEPKFLFFAQMLP